MTLEGAQVWEVMRAAEGQMRTLGPVVIGFDAGAVLALAAAAGCDPTLTAYVLSDVGAIAARRINEQVTSHG